MESFRPSQLLISGTARPSATQNPVLLFLGDFYVRPGHAARTATEIFGPELIEMVQRSTLSLVNFEGTLATAQARKIPKKGPHLASCHTAPALLKSAGFKAVTLANNHSMDYGREGMQATLTACADCGLQCVGAGLDRMRAMQPLKLSLPGDVSLQILAFCEREFGVTTGDAPGTAWLKSPDAENAVHQAKQESDLVIVCAHGGNELMPLPSSQRRRQLHDLIDAGADLVIGHHPHVPQGWEQYSGRYIFYSLGDFYFDGLNGQRYECRDWGFAVRAHIAERRIETLEIVPYHRLEHQAVLFATEAEANSHVAGLVKLSQILAGPDSEGYWQQLATNRFSGYVPFFRSRPAYAGLCFRERLKETLQLGRDLWRLWGLRRTPPTSALATLNLVRCDSHRWTIETALGVLSGECEDQRSSRIKQEVLVLEQSYRKERA